MKRIFTGKRQPIDYLNDIIFVFALCVPNAWNISMGQCYLLISEFYLLFVQGTLY